MSQDKLFTKSLFQLFQKLFSVCDDKWSKIRLKWYFDTFFCWFKNLCTSTSFKHWDKRSRNSIDVLYNHSVKIGKTYEDLDLPNRFWSGKFLIFSISFGCICILEIDTTYPKNCISSVPYRHFLRLTNSPYFCSYPSTYLIAFLFLTLFSFM